MYVCMCACVQYKQHEQQRVAVGPGNAQFMSIRQVLLRRSPLQLQRCCCSAAAAADAAVIKKFAN